MSRSRQARVLVVEDDEDIRELIRYHLHREGLQVSEVASAEAALAHIGRHETDLVLLDLMLPDMDGLECCRRIRGGAGSPYIPVLMVTAKAEETDVVVGLELGADDYLCKPFKPRELVARTKALLRRASAGQALSGEADRLERGELTLHLGRREALLRGNPLDLTFTEFEVLRLLASRPGWVFSRYQIVDAVRGKDYAVTDRSVDVQVVGIRRKLGPDAALLETVRGVGYRFRDDTP